MNLTHQKPRYFPPVDDDLALEGQQFVTFHLAGEEYGVGILSVQEIIGYKELTRVPKVAAFIKGVLNLRGAVVPVVDLRAKFGMPEVEYNKFTVILIVNVQERIVGMTVDAVSDVIAFKDEDIQPTPDFSSNVRTEFITGMGRMDEKFIILLDVDKILSLEEMSEVDSVSSQ